MKKIRNIIITLFLCAVMTCSASAVSHTVVKGDTMWKLSREYGVTLQSVIDSNPHIEDPDLIYPGDVLMIPVDGADALSSYEREVVRLLNEERIKRGLAALKINTRLSYVARLKAKDMRDKNYFSHTSPTYGTPFQMMKDFGIFYRSAGENIAMGQRTPSEVMTAWMNSPGHRANILNSNYTEVGVGYVSDGNVWTQEFIG